MALHHYVPRFVLRRFACADAWKLLNLPDHRLCVIRRNQQALVSEGGRSGSTPLCVLSKRRRRFTVQTVRNTCARANYYSTVSYDDPLLAGMLQHNLQQAIGEERNLTDPVAELREIGREHVDTEAAERAGTTKADNELGALVPRIQRREPLDSEATDTLLRAMVFARFRVPAWRETYFDEMAQQAEDFAKRTTADLGLRADRQLRKDGLTTDYLFRPFSENFYVITVLQHTASQLNILRDKGINVAVFHAAGSARFITCDNAARPFYPSDLRRFQFQTVPGLGDPDALAAYPLSPRACIIATSSGDLAGHDHVDVGEDDVRLINTALLLSAYDETIIPGPTLDGFFLSWVRPHRVAVPRNP